LAVEVSVSIGIADTKSIPVRSKEELIALADEALFQAKKEGRNRIKVYEAVPRSGVDPVQSSSAQSTGRA
ncbi:MAG TPA: diguanylate cyclase, partial [Syntrophobacteria bacterium]|nr:diguanylate cyclase [Syntrophobacteria bacterium]